MKHTLVILLLSVCSFSAIARSNSAKQPAISNMTMHKPFRQTNLDIAGNNLSFSRLPRRATDVYVIDAAGHVATSGRLTRNKNTVDMRKLQAGVYTIVLQQGRHVKMFGYCSDIIITVPRPLAVK